MDYSFTTKEELFQRIKPALNAKQREFARLGYFYIQSIDIWNYLVEEKWPNSKQLSLSDIVADIMHSEARQVEIYMKGKNYRARRTTRSYDQEVI